MNKFDVSAPSVGRPAWIHPWYSSCSEYGISTLMIGVLPHCHGVHAPSARPSRRTTALRVADKRSDGVPSPVGGPIAPGLAYVCSSWTTTR